MFVFGLGQSPLSGLPQGLSSCDITEAYPSRTRNHHCAFLQVTRTRYIARSVSFYPLKCVHYFNVWLSALGLVAGKGASFISARISYPLSQWSPNAPFYASAATTGFSFAINLIYISISKWLIREAGAELEDSELRTEAKRRSVVSMTEAQAIQQVADRRRFRIKEVFKLGDVVWACVQIVLP